MGRKKIAIQPIIDERNRNVTFNKRKNGLIKKAMELSILCNCNISLVIFNTENQLHEYCSTDPRFILQHYCQVAHLPHERLSNADYYQRFDRRSSSASGIDKKKPRTSISVDDENSASSSSSATTGTSLGSEGSIDEDDYDDEDFDDEMVGAHSTTNNVGASSGGLVGSGGIVPLGVLGAPPTGPSSIIPLATASGGGTQTNPTAGLIQRQQQRRASIFEAMAAAAAAGAGGGVASHPQQRQQHLDQFPSISTSSAPMSLQQQQQQQLNLEQAASLYNTISASNALLSAAAAAAAAASSSSGTVPAAQQGLLPSNATSNQLQASSGGGVAAAGTHNPLHQQPGFANALVPNLFNLQLNPLRFQADAYGLAQQHQAQRQRLLQQQQQQQENAVANLVPLSNNAKNVIKPEVVPPQLYSIEEIKRMLVASGNSAATEANPFSTGGSGSNSNSATVNVEKQG